VDRGIAPFVISRSLKAAHDAIGQHASLEGLTTGVRLALPRCGSSSSLTTRNTSSTR